MANERIDRRHFIKTIGAGAGLLTMNPLWSCGPQKSRRPNVLFIAIDDLNDWTGCLGGHPDVKTPNLDWLVKRGVLFTRAYCAAPACNPSRAALMTGIQPSTSGVYYNSQPWRDSPVLKKAVTLPQHFMAHGYSAIGSGKIYHGRFPDPSSWQEYWPSQMKNKPDDPVPDNRPLNGIPNTAHFDWGPVNVQNSEMGDWHVADWVIGRLQQEQEQPFFLACGFYRPHLPWYVPQKYFDMYPVDKIVLPDVNENDLDDVPEAGRRMAKPEGDHRRVIQYGQWRNAVQGYLASISFMDACLGRVIDALDNSPARDDTVLVLWSDHGWHLGEKLHWRKFALWEEATHNVLAFVVPGVTPPESRCEWPVSLLDIYPTLVELCGLTELDGLEGNSLVPVLKNPARQWDKPVLTTYGRKNHSIRSMRWRFIRYADGTEELYDHDRDPMEWTNLAENQELVAVKKELAGYLPDIDAAGVPGVL